MAIRTGHQSLELGWEWTMMLKKERLSRGIFYLLHKTLFIFLVRVLRTSVECYRGKMFFFFFFFNDFIGHIR